MEKIYEIGDYDFNNPGHHGTPNERALATYDGYRMGYDGLAYRTVFSRGAERVLEIF